MSQTTNFLVLMWPFTVLSLCLQLIMHPGFLAKEISPSLATLRISLTYRSNHKSLGFEKCVVVAAPHVNIIIVK